MLFNSRPCPPILQSNLMMKFTSIKCTKLSRSQHYIYACKNSLLEAMPPWRVFWVDWCKIWGSILQKLCRTRNGGVFPKWGPQKCEEALTQ